MNTKWITFNFGCWYRYVNEHFIATRIVDKDFNWTPFIVVSPRHPEKGITYMDGFEAGKRHEVENDRSRNHKTD